MSPNIEIYLCLSAVVLAASGLLAITDWIRLRRAARRIDSAYKRLSREPQWSQLRPSDITPRVLARLDAWDALCVRELGLTPFGRLQEHCADGEKLGVRTMLISADRTVVATLACSHFRPEISFRSFASITDGNFILVSDAHGASSKPPHFVIAPFSKEASEKVMFNRLLELRDTVEGRPRPFLDLDGYARFQQQMWRDAHTHRRSGQYVVELESLRKLAPPNLPEARLRRIHQEIVRLNN